MQPKSQSRGSSLNASSIRVLPRCEIVAEAGDSREAVRKAIETKPDIAVLHYSLPLLNHIEATRQIRSHLPKTAILIFTMPDNDMIVREILKAGARGYLLKSDAGRHLIGAIESVASHKPFFTTKVSEALVASFLKTSSHEGPALTNPERSVVQLIAEGHANKQIANLFNISVKTVETHRAATIRKLNLSSSAALVRYAIRNKIVQP